jgi:hypothetical protein
MADRPAQPIPLLAVIRGAFVLPARHVGELFRAASLPLLALIAVTLYAALTEPAPPPTDPPA